MTTLVTFSVKVHYHYNVSLYRRLLYRKFTITGTLNIYSFVGNKLKIVNLLRILVMKMDTLNRIHNSRSLQAPNHLNEIKISGKSTLYSIWFDHCSIFKYYLIFNLIVQFKIIFVGIDIISFEIKWQTSELATGVKILLAPL